VFDITPPSGGNESVVLTTLSGANFRNEATVLLRKAGCSDILADGISIVNANQITCQFDLTGAVPGLWDVVVINPDGQSDPLPNGFTVNPELHHFIFSSIGNQTVNVPFTVTLTAHDRHDSAVTDFTGTANLSDSTGTVNPTVTGNFVAGVWTGTLTIAIAQADVTITATSGGRSGVSGSFHVAYPAPSVTKIVPITGVNTEMTTVTITGSDFFPTPSARLGVRSLQNVAFISDTTLTAIVPTGIAAGPYDLYVTNPGPLAPTDILMDAFTVQNAVIPDTTLETSFLTIYGIGGMPKHEGDNDSVQVIFLEVPSTSTETLYVRIYDPDVGGGGDTETIDAARPPSDTKDWDTAITFSLYGGDDAYTHPNARRATFATTTDPGITSGTWITSQTFTQSHPGHPHAWDHEWFTLQAITPNQGEDVDGKRVFKLSVVGGPGDDGNRYNVALSTSDTGNIAPSGARIFAYSWTFLLPTPDSLQLYPFVASSASTLIQYNLDFDRTPDCDGASITITTRTGEAHVVPSSSISENGEEATYNLAVPGNEQQATWSVQCTDLSAFRNDGTLWVTDQGDVPLPIFTRSTTEPAPLP